MLDLTREITVTDLIEHCGLTMNVDPDPDTSGKREKFMPNGHHYLCTLRIKGSDTATRKRTLTVPFSMGSARTDTPTLADVMDALIADATIFEDCQGDMYAFAAQLGYLTESDDDLKVLRRDYRTAERWARKLHVWLPDGVTVDNLREEG